MSKNLIRAFLGLPPAEEPKANPSEDNAPREPDFVQPPMQTWIVTTAQRHEKIKAHFFAVEPGGLYAYEQTGWFFSQHIGNRIAGWHSWLSFRREDEEPSA